MSMHFEKKMPLPAEIKAKFPLSETIREVKKQRDREIRDIFSGKSDRFLLIIGPCSADSEDAVLDYLGRLSKVQEQVADRIMIVPRIYTNKPRTTGKGYKGLLHQPDLSGKPDLLSGLIAIRELHMRSIEQTGLTAADAAFSVNTGDATKSLALGDRIWGGVYDGYGFSFDEGILKFSKLA